MTTGREVALDALEQIRIDDAYSNLVLPRVIRESRLSSRDAGHVTDLVYGSLRWRGFLDAVIDECITGPIERVDDDVRQLLRLATYELVVRIEPRHIVNEWVTVANSRFRRAAGFVNATLRAVARRSPDEWRAALVAGKSDNDARSIVFSHPLWIVNAFSELVSDGELDSLLAADNEPPTPTLIALPGLAQRPPGSDSTMFSPYGFRSSGGSLNSVDGVAEGVVRVQDEGSQLAALALVAASPIRASERWLDLCAGPGGKSALLAAFAVPEGIRLDANEVQPHRAELVRQSLAPFNGRIDVSVRDGRELCAENPSAFDRILVDVPCTGLGALRRRPESRWRKTPEDVLELAPLQRELLAGAINAVAVGGIVAYVTCSPLTSETEDVVRAVLDEHPEAEVMDTAEVLSSVAPALRESRRGTAVQLYPHRHHTDAMFIQLIRKTR